MKEIIFLSGGGTALDSKELDLELVNNINERKLEGIIYIPLARQPTSYDESLEWFKGAFKDKIKNIKMWLTLKDKSLNDLVTVGSVYIGGGNTLSLMSAFRESSFDEVLTEFVRLGGIVYGGSAGAIILGKDIRTAPEVAKRTGVVDFDGLNLLGGYSIACHFKPENLDKLKKVSNEIESPIIALSEKSGIRFSRGDICSFGTGLVYIIRKEQFTTLHPHQNLKIKI